VSVLLQQAEVAEAALLVRPDNEPRDLAAADVEQVRCVRPHLPELHSTRLAPSNDVIESARRRAEANRTALARHRPWAAE
jgi:hypothetical protein